ncbi:acyl-CoA synthetase, putative [Plasmodium reichenowi]|uniref:Acyl-CoA synthetase, putative n=1 Tax=Plasmodium reichenowi TaxID=5854 RepID=A0A2P9DS91_PLARE|nr:acyl-CoA synthetase, putative [Plasmodium reichenowi]
MTPFGFSDVPDVYTIDAVKSGSSFLILKFYDLTFPISSNDIITIPFPFYLYFHLITQFKLYLFYYYHLNQHYFLYYFLLPN